MWSRIEDLARRYEDLAAAFIVLVGILYRFRIAAEQFLNPEEAFHSMLSRAAEWPLLFTTPIVGSHPPLALLVLNAVQNISYSEVVLRAPMVIAGGLAPWFVYLWLKRVRGSAAGMIALIILCMAPNLIMLTTQLRGYPFAFCFMAVALYSLERAIVQDSPRWMTSFTASLCLAILSEYLVAVFCVAAGIYFLLHLRTGNISRRLARFWVGGQVLALGVWALLAHFRLARRGLLPHKVNHVEALYADRGDLLGFFYEKSNEVFEYLTSSLVLGSAAIVLFVVGVVLLWSGRPWQDTPPRPKAGLLLLLPFLAGAAAAIAGFYPYGGTRHNLHLMLFGAIGVAVALEVLFRRKLTAIGLAALVLVPIWVLRGPDDPYNADRHGQKKEDLLEAVEFIRENVEPGSIILTEGESRLILSHYLDPEATWPRGIVYRNGLERVGGYTLFAPSFVFYSLEDVRIHMRELKETFGLSPEDEVWVVDTGFRCNTRLHMIQAQSQLTMPVVREFGPGIVVYRTNPGFERRP